MHTPDASQTHKEHTHNDARIDLAEGGPSPAEAMTVGERALAISVCEQASPAIRRVLTSAAT